MPLIIVGILVLLYSGDYCFVVANSMMLLAMILLFLKTIKG